MNFDFFYVLPKDCIYNLKIWQNGVLKIFPIKAKIIGENDYNYIEDNGSQFPKLDIIYIYEDKKESLIKGSKFWFGNILPNGKNT